MPSSATDLSLHRPLALVGAALLLLATLFGWFTWEREKEDQLQQLRTVAEIAEKATDRYLVQLQLALGDLSADVLADGGLAELGQARELLARFQAQHAELAAASLMALDGRVLATSKRDSLSGLPTTAGIRNYAELVSRLKPEKPMELGRPLLGVLSGRWILPLTYTVRDAGGHAVAFIVASLPVEMLPSFWRDAPVVEHAVIGLLRDDGHLLSRYPLPKSATEEQIYGSPRDGGVVQHLKSSGYPLRGTIEGRSSLTGGSFVNAFVRLEHFPVTLVVATPMSRLREVWWIHTRVPLLMLALLGLAGGVALHRWHRGELAWRVRQRESADRLQRSEALLERTGRVAGVGGWQADLRSNTVAWSSHTYRIHEVEPDYVPTLERSIDFFVPEHRPLIRAAIDEALRSGQAWDLELQQTTARGRPIWVRVLGEVEHADGRPLRLVGAFQDITEYRQRRAELRQEKVLRQQAEQQAQELDALLKERGHMLDVLAHEVRQPLHNASAALQSAAAVLTELAAQPAIERLTRAHAVLGQVTGSIDNTLAVAALLARPDPIRCEDTDIDMLLALTIADITADQRARIVIERLSTSRTASVDMSLVRLALRNLLVNALRFGPAGTPVVVRVSDSDEPLALLIDVIDQGPGIEPGLEGGLFQRGARGTRSAGHGLGLYIVRRVMELHGGQVTLLRNRPGELAFRLSFELRAGD